MICWENKLNRNILFCGGILLAALTAGGPSWAQAPVPLRPPTQTTGDGLQTPAPQPPIGHSFPPAPTDGISSSALGEPDFAGAGLLTEENGGFGQQMWLGADRAFVERLLLKIPVTTSSPALQKLTRRLLLSAADAPQGEAQARSFLGLRLSLLIAAGQFDLAAQLAALGGEPTRDEGVLEARAWLALIANEIKTACDMAAATVKTSSALFWLKLSGFCHVINGDEAAANLSAAMVAEQDPDDNGYQSLLTALINKSGKLPKLTTRPDSLQLAMIRFASLPLPAKPADDATAAELNMMARMPALAAELRLPAAERAEAVGSISPEELVHLYSEVPFSVDERARARDIVGKLSAAKANALLYQSVRQQDSPASLALALSTALSQARNTGSFASIARANLTPLRDLVPMPDMIENAALFGRALLAAGDAVAAARWHELARALSQPGNNPAAAKAAYDLWPLLRLSQPPEIRPDDPAELSTWLAQLKPEEKASKGAVLLSALAALGHATQGAEWIQLMGDLDHQPPVTMPPAALLHLLMETSLTGNQGQTVLLGLACLGEKAEGLANPFILGMVVRALKTAGLQAEARALALDAALLAGV